MKHLGFVKTRWFIFVAGLLLASLVILGIRFTTYEIPHTHYHANFALYMNGKREEFKAAHYYEEIAACSVHGTIQPAQRAHMHDEINDVIHVHDDGVTWEQFFNNIGWSLGPNFIQTDTKTLYVEDDTNKLNIMLNGQNLTDLTTINNQVIKDEDRLLVSFGNIDNSTLAKEYKTVPATAHHYDITPDPASCAGQAENPSFSERLKHLF
jgi:hypothetical protein